MKTEKKKGISLLGTLLLMGAVPLMVAAIIMITIAAFSIMSEVKSETFEKLEVAAVSVDQYFAYDVIANGKVDYEEYADHEFIESVQNQNVELTLFEGDTRFITSLKNDDGSYNEGTKASDEVFATVSKGEKYTSEDDVINGVDYYVFYEPVYDGDGQFWGMAFAGTPQKIVKAAINKAVIQLVVSAAVVAILFSVIITILAIRIRKSISLVASDLTKLSEGDLSVHIDISDAIIEVKDIINATNVLQGKLSEVIGDVKKRTKMLSTSVNEVQRAANETSTGTDQIATAMEELSTSTMTLTENVQSVNAQAIEMGNYIQGITENVDNLASASDEIKDATEKAQILMTQVLESSDQSSDAAEEINESISLTNESIIKITEAVDFITSIAEQTNLLSLNAAIEAARAGEAGKGFAVVAEEIGKLATDSANTAGTIKDLATDMNDKSARTVELAGKIGNIISEEKATVGSTQEAFSTLGAAIEESLAMISEIDSKAGELLGIKDGIIGNISDLSSIAQENAASNQEITASVTDISERANDMSAQSDSMEALSEQLAEAVEYFK